MGKDTIFQFRNSKWSYRSQEQDLPRKCSKKTNKNEFYNLASHLSSIIVFEGGNKEDLERSIKETNQEEEIEKSCQYHFQIKAGLLVFTLTASLLSKSSKDTILKDNYLDWLFDFYLKHLSNTLQLHSSYTVTDSWPRWVCPCVVSTLPLHSPTIL